MWAAEQGITSGTSATTFSPDAPCTRAQTAAFIYRCEQAKGGGFTGAWMFRLPFTDTPEWAYESIAWCYKEGITSGTSATTFSPDAPCTRAQAVSFLWRAAGRPTPTSSQMAFTDVAPDSYYRTAVLWAVENKITSGTSATTFSPDATCTRGQIVTFLYRAMGSE